MQKRKADAMGRTALKREFYGKRGYVEVRFIKSIDRRTGQETIRIKGGKGPYRFPEERFPDLYSAVRHVADHIAAIDRAQA